MNIYEESLQFHKQLRGKLEVSSRVKRKRICKRK